MRTFLQSLQDEDGGFHAKNRVKATAEYLLVLRFCPSLDAGDAAAARAFLRESLPVFASHEVRRDFTSMEKIWQAAVGIPEETTYLSSAFLELSLSEAMDASSVSSLLFLLFLQKTRDEKMRIPLERVVNYQKKIMSGESLDAVYETTHNVMTFHLAEKEGFNTGNITRESCEWLSVKTFLVRECVDAAAEVLSVTNWVRYAEGDTDMRREILHILMENQNEDGGFPVYREGSSEFHSSLVSLWALMS